MNINTKKIRSFIIIIISIILLSLFEIRKNYLLSHAYQAIIVKSLTGLESQLENILKETHVPGISIAIVNRSGPIWTAGLGKADLANNRSANAETLFRIGSISKGFISLAILSLVQEGKLSLEDPVHKVAPEVVFQNKWEATNPIRIVHLLENTTGWDDMHLREFAINNPTISLAQAINYDPSSRVSRWHPGTRMAYSNSGPAVAAYIVEKITGKNFEQYISEKFFQPIGMLTATYKQPLPEITTMLYHTDGKTVYPYWNLLYRPIGALNASARDMASYLLFYLNRGKVHDKQIIPASFFDRIETATSTWAAQEGLPIGYGLGNYATVRDGFVYHGHDGNIPGALSAMQYLPHEGIGYFFSINSNNRAAFNKIDATIRAYITCNLQKQSVEPATNISEKADAYSGWYEPNSPRVNVFYGLERLFGLTHINVQENNLIMTPLFEKNSLFVPVSDTEFRYAPANESPDPVPTLKFLNKNGERQFIQISLGLRNPALLHITLKHIPTWLAILEIISLAFIVLMYLSMLVYVFYWILLKLRKKSHYGKDNNLLLWPAIGVLSLITIFTICAASSEVGIAIERLGNLSIWSFSIFSATIVFAYASIASAITILITPKNSVRYSMYIFSIMITMGLAISTLYLAYWSLIGLRTWI